MADEKKSTAAAPKGRRDTVTTLLMSAAALAAIAGFAGLFSLWWQSGVTDPQEVLRVASQEFISGRPIVAGELAATVTFPGELVGDDELADANLPAEAPLDGKPGSTPPPLTEAEKKQAAAEQEQRDQWIRLRDFLVGAGKMAHSQLEVDLRDRRTALLDALPYLERANRVGFPPGRQAQGHRMLGECLFHLARFDDAITAINQAIDFDPTLRRDLWPMLAQSQLRSPLELSGDALGTIDTYLASGPLNVHQQWQAQQIRVRALIELERWREAGEAIDAALQARAVNQLTLQDDEAEFRNQMILLQGVAAIKQAMSRHGAMPREPLEDRTAVIAELTPIMELLADLQREAEPHTAAQARLWSARAALIQGWYDDALTHFTTIRQQRPFGAEGVLGGLEEIELLARLNRGVEMLQTTRYLIREIGEPQNFDSGLITLEAFRRRLTDALAQLRQHRDFPNAVDIARSLPPVFTASEALMQEAIGYQQWADDTMAEGTDPSGDVAPNASNLARARYRAGGDAYAEAARLLFNTEQYLPAQWAAIDAYQKGRHFRRSIRLLEPYLRYEQRRRLPRGLVAYGRALLAEGDATLAVEALNSCIEEYPRDPLRYDARLLIALAHAENDDLDTARRYLTDNLQDGELTPQSPAWRDSLFALGELLYDRSYRNYLLAQHVDPNQQLTLLQDNQPLLEETVRYLDEAVQRYWPLPQAESAAYQSARAHMMAAQWPRLESQSQEILDAARRTLRGQADQQLQAAYDGFGMLRKHLTTREEELRLTLKQQTMLRNCFLAEADVLREMNRIDEAAGAYRTVELRYMNEPPALEAILGRVRCAKQLGRSREADLLLRQASLVLDRIPEEWDGRFAEMTRYDREGWRKYLTWMNGRITGQGA